MYSLGVLEESLQIRDGLFFLGDILSCPDSLVESKIVAKPYVSRLKYIQLIHNSQR